MPKAIEAVEQGQYRSFAGPVRVYVCASMESFRSYGLRVGYAAGFVFNQRLFLSPSLKTRPRESRGFSPPSSRICTWSSRWGRIGQRQDYLTGFGKGWPFTSRGAAAPRM